MKNIKDVVTLKDINLEKLEEYNELKCVDFVCENDLTPFVDSMLFDSDMDAIASATFEYKGREFIIDLRVCGEVSLTFKGEMYFSPDEYPDELIERIRNHPDDWDCYAPSGEGNDDAEGDIYINLNNWFAYVYGEDDIFSEDSLFEDDLSKYTPQQIFDDMVYVIGKEIEVTENARKS